MGGFSALLMNLFVKNYLLSSLSALLFSFSPVMMERAFRHVALTAHFLIIASLYYYFKNKGNWTLKNSIPLIVINTLAIGIHPYFLPFTFGISFAMFLEWSISKKEILKPCSFILISLANTLLFGYIIGAFYSFDSAGDIGYGLYSLNLNSYFNPVSNGIENWSNILNPLNMAERFQVEAFNYLGFGVIIALIISFITFIFSKSIRKAVLDILKCSYGLIFSTIALTIFAITNIVTANGATLLNIQLPSFIIDLCSIFRASGRFGWLLHYLFYIIVIFCISKIKIKNLAPIILSFIIIIQIYDISPAISAKNDYFKNNAPENNIHTVLIKANDEFWDIAFNDFNSIIAIPNGSPIPNGSIEFAIRAGKKNSDMLVNVAFEARAANSQRAEYIALVNSDLLNGIIDESTMYMLDEADSYKSYIVNGEYQAFTINGQILMFKTRYSNEEIVEFEKSETFSQIVF